MKKTIRYFMILLLAGLFAAPTVNAQPMRKPIGEKMAAHRVLVKSAFVIHHAYKKVKENKVYTGNLAKAIAHQKYARKLYREGKYLRAMHQSRRARWFAALASEANKGTVSEDMKFSKEDEEKMSKNAQSDEELDKEVQAAMPNEPTKDE